MKGKTITFVFAQIYPDFTGGAEVFNYYLLREISKSHKIVLISHSDPGISGIKLYKIKRIKPVRLIYPLQLFLFLYKSSRNSDAIYTSFSRASWLVYIPVTLFSVLFNVPYSFTIHGGGMKRWRFKLPFQIFFKKARAITGVSYRICEEYSNRTGLDIRYLPPLIPFLTSSLTMTELRQRYKIPADSQVFLFVGSLKPLKNPLHVLRALNLLGNDFLVKQKIRLVYAGDGILREDLLRYLDENGLSGFVYMQGNVPLETIHELYSIADFYVISSDFEGTPIALLEAMHNSLPVIASDAPGINNFLTNNETAILYRTGDTGALAKAIEKLTEDPVIRSYLRLNAKKYYDEHFDYRKIVGDYVNIITS